MIASVIVAIIVAVIIAAAVIEAYLKRNRHTSLSSSRPKRTQEETKPELGMEATDTKLVDAAHRQNEQIQRLHGQLSKRSKK